MSRESPITYQHFVKGILPNLESPRYLSAGGTKHWHGLRQACNTRGVHLERITGQRRESFSLYRSQLASVPIGEIRGMLTNLISSPTVKIARNKVLTWDIWAQADLPIPAQRVFGFGQYAEALSWAMQNYFYVVVKPVKGAGGERISLSIRNEQDFMRAWLFANSGNQTSREIKIIVQGKIPGIDLCALIINGTFACGTTRIPANVVGDGRSSVDELIFLKNRNRASHPHHRRFPILIDDGVHAFLLSQGLSLYSVPRSGDVVFLSNLSNIHRGGDACEVTHLIPSQIQRIAELATSSLPEAGVLGVDLMITGFRREDSAVLLEANAFANFSLHHTPLWGEPQDPAGHVVDAFIARATPT